MIASPITKELVRTESLRVYRMALRTLRCIPSAQIRTKMAYNICEMYHIYNDSLEMAREQSQPNAIGTRGVRFGFGHVTEAKGQLNGKPLKATPARSSPLGTASISDGLSDSLSPSSSPTPADSQQASLEKAWEAIGQAKQDLELMQTIFQTDKALLYQLFASFSAPTEENDPSLSSWAAPADIKSTDSSRPIPNQHLPNLAEH